MKKVFSLLFFLVLLQSCKTLILVDRDEMAAIENVKSFKFEDFDIYVFNICEKFKNSDREERFCECPENFYDVALNDNLRKVEELYLLKHKESDIVIYLTTFSHKYISKEGKGFLNDREFYNNNIVLDQIENAYIGRFDDKLNIIHFPSVKDDKDIILHFSPIDLPKKLFFTQANVATAENKYDVSVPISLDSVFKQNLEYLKKDYKMSYYHGTNDMASKTPKIINLINIISDDGKVELIFRFENWENGYKMSSKRIRYHPNFYLIQQN